MGQGTGWSGGACWTKCSHRRLQLLLGHQSRPVPIDGLPADLQGLGRHLCQCGHSHWTSPMRSCLQLCLAELHLDCQHGRAGSVRLPGLLGLASGLYRWCQRFHGVLGSLPHVCGRHQAHLQPVVEAPEGASLWSHYYPGYHYSSASLHHSHPLRLHHSSGNSPEPAFPHLGAIGLLVEEHAEGELWHQHREVRPLCRAGLDVLGPSCHSAHGHCEVVYSRQAGDQGWPAALRHRHPHGLRHCLCDRPVLGCCCAGLRWCLRQH
mmetsp:Transcript_3918/g.5604  ORF Transcript_3918/g.5604 Transcript_3918/m.5604 type:complete len:264 (-) Transcript_3918:753-1544(-)